MYLRSVLIKAGPGAQYRMQIGNMFTLKFLFCPSKGDSWRLSAIEMSLGNVHKATARFNITAQLNLKFLPITQNEVPFTNTGEVTKKVE